MRLINTGSYVPGGERLEMIQKWGKAIPQYAILSHTWSANPDHEVSLSDVRDGTASTKPGFAKLEKALERARLDGHGWLWDDTCCIDKTSSVELTEAINSMYDYYRHSRVCYAFLADVHSEEAGSGFLGSKWWTRGWTLQELLAPRGVEFFNSTWTPLGSKKSLSEIIWRRTGIDRDYLTGRLPVEHASVAKRMSWQASRETTRDEDVAYSMIGLFDVNMPMLYGEGALKAFTRLQEEIMKTNEDQSLFAWIKDGDESSSENGLHGLLADSPVDFKRAGEVVSYTDARDFKPSTMSARGLNLELPFTFTDPDSGIAALCCRGSGKNMNGWIAVYLRKLNTGANQWARVDCDKLAIVTKRGTSKEVFVRQRFSNFPTQNVFPDHYFQLRSLTCCSKESQLHDYKLAKIRVLTANPIRTRRTEPPAAPRASWASGYTGGRLFYRIDQSADSLTAELTFKGGFDGDAFVVMLGTRWNYDVGVQVVSASTSEASSHEIRGVFNADVFGQGVDLKYHTVRVTADEEIRNNCKIYLVDIHIDPLRGLRE